MAIFDHSQPKKTLNKLLAFMNLHQLEEITLFHLFTTVNFRVPWPDWPHPFLTNAHQKFFWSAFKLCYHVSTCKTSVYSIWFILQIQSILESCPRLTTPIFEHAHPKNFRSPFSLCEMVPTWKKSVNSIGPFLRYNQF